MVGKCIVLPGKEVIRRISSEISIRLIVAAIRAKIRIRDETYAVREERIENFIDTKRSRFVQTTDADTSYICERDGRNVASASTGGAAANARVYQIE